MWSVFSTSLFLQALSNEYLPAKIGVDTGENQALKGLPLFV